MAEKNIFPISQILRKMVTRKNPDDALAGAAKGGLEKTLGVWDLIIPEYLLSLVLQLQEVLTVQAPEQGLL